MNKFTPTYCAQAIIAKLLKPRLKKVLALTIFIQILPAQAQAPIAMQALSQDLDFGVIASENGICRMNDRGSLIGLSGQSCLGSGTRGIFNIMGEPGRVIYITANGSGNNSGVAFTPKISGSANKVIAANGKALLVVAGDLHLNNANGGKHSLDYVICVHYE